MSCRHSARCGDRGIIGKADSAQRIEVPPLVAERPPPGFEEGIRVPHVHLSEDTTQGLAVEHAVDLAVHIVHIVLPVAPAAREKRAAEILEHRGAMVLDAAAPLRRRIGVPVHPLTGRIPTCTGP